MKCQHCNAYVPSGLGLKQCPQCGRELDELSDHRPISKAEDPSSPAAAGPVKSKRRPYILYTILVVFVSLVLLGLWGAARTVVGRSCYASDVPVAKNSWIPDNRVYIWQGSFFRLLIRYPEDLQDSIGGEEIHLKNGGATHQANIALAPSIEAPVRYRIKSFVLRSLDGKNLENIVYHPVLTRDILKKQGAPYDWKAALIETTSLTPKCDFTYSSSPGDIFYGYFLTRPPDGLVLDFDIDVYTLDGSRKESVTDTIRLHRLNEAPDAYIRASIRR